MLGWLGRKGYYVIRDREVLYVMRSLHLYLAVGVICKFNAVA